MQHPTPDPSRRPISDDQAARLARLRDSKTPMNGKRVVPVARRQHPARGARAIALVASLGATGGIGLAMAYSDGALVTETVVGTASEISTVPATIRVIEPLTVPQPEPTATLMAEPLTVPQPEPTAAPETPEPLGGVNAESGGYNDGAFSGTAEYTRWGDVRVEVTIVDGQLVDIIEIQMPNDRKSAQINRTAVPVLEAQAIAAQTADLDIVSGATYTSQAYEASLQAALDQAAIAEQTDRVET